MRRVLPLALLFLPLLTLGACASTTRWEKPGVDQAAAQNDIKECQSAAQREAFYYSPPFPYWGPPYWGPRRYPFGYYSGWSSDRFFTENRLTAFCMRSRGYELVKVEQKDK